MIGLGSLCMEILYSLLLFSFILSNNFFGGPMAKEKVYNLILSNIWFLFVNLTFVLTWMQVRITEITGSCCF